MFVCRNCLQRWTRIPMGTTLQLTLSKYYNDSHFKDHRYMQQLIQQDDYLHLHNYFLTPGVFHKKSSSQCANRTRIYSTYFRAVRNHCQHKDIRNFFAWTIRISPSIVTQSKSIQMSSLGFVELSHTNNQILNKTKYNY